MKDKKIDRFWIYAWIEIDTEDKLKLLQIIKENQQFYLDKCNEANQYKEELEELYKKTAEYFLAREEKSFIQKLFK